MTSMTHAAIAASVLVALMAVPAASQSVDFSEEFSDEFSSDSVVEDTEDIPEQVSKTTAPGSFQATLKTAFSEFTTALTPGSAEASIESPDSELEVSRTASKDEWVLTTSRGTLTVIESSDAEVEEVSTPHGDLKIEVRNGREKTEFSGSDRGKVEEVRHELRLLLEDRKKDMSDKQERLQRQALPDIEIIANESTASGFEKEGIAHEHVILVNNGFEPVNLNGWELTDQNEDMYNHIFGNVELGPGEKLHVYRGSEDEIENPEKPAVFDTKIAWAKGGDTATLYNENGVKVAEESY